MTPLRQKMIEAMQLRGFSPRTQSTYLYTVRSLARYYGRPPDQLTVADVQTFLQYLAVEKKLAASSCRLHLNGIRFLFTQVLGLEAFNGEYAIPKRKQRIPELLTRAEVLSLIRTRDNLKHHTLLSTCYGCGLRLSELIHLKVRDIDGERSLLRVEQGKGGKDRRVPMPPTLLNQLRQYWHQQHPGLWLFPGRDLTQPLSPASAQRVYQAARTQAGITKVGGIHALRHAYATHQLEAGLPIHRLQRQLGHQDIHSTLRYAHWVPNAQERRQSVDLLAVREDTPCQRA